MNTRHLIAALALTTAATASAEPKNLLFYGSSFTGSGGGVHLLVRDIATGRAKNARLRSRRRRTDAPVPPRHRHLRHHLGHHARRELGRRRPREYSTAHHPPERRQRARIPERRTGALSGRPVAQPRRQGRTLRNWPAARATRSTRQSGPNPQRCRPSARQLQPRQLRPERHRHLRGHAVGDAFENAGFNLDLYAGDIYHASNKARSSSRSSSTAPSTTTPHSPTSISQPSRADWASQPLTSTTRSSTPRAS